MRKDLLEIEGELRAALAAMFSIMPSPEWRQAVDQLTATLDKVATLAWGEEVRVDKDQVPTVVPDRRRKESLTVDHERHEREISEIRRLIMESASY